MTIWDAFLLVLGGLGSPLAVLVAAAIAGALSVVLIVVSAVDVEYGEWDELVVHAPIAFGLFILSATLCVWASSAPDLFSWVAR